MTKIGFWKRAFAIIIDIILIDIAVKIGLLPLERTIDFESIKPADLLSGISAQSANELILFIILYLLAGLFFSAVYFTYFHGSTGQTIGKWLLRIKVIKTNGEPLDYKIAFIRWMGYFVSKFAMLLGFIWVIFDKDKQGWHDKIAGTYVIKV